MMKGIGEFGVKRKRLIESNFKMTLGRRNLATKITVKGLYG